MIEFLRFVAGWIAGFFGFGGREEVYEPIYLIVEAKYGDGTSKFFVTVDNKYVGKIRSQLNGEYLPFTRYRNEDHAIKEGDYFNTIEEARDFIFVVRKFLSSKTVVCRSRYSVSFAPRVMPPDEDLTKEGSVD